MGVPLNPNPLLNVGPAAPVAEVQLNPPRGFDLVWSLNHADDVGLVWRVAGETDSEDEDSAYESEEEHVPEGQASVSWLKRRITENEDLSRLRVLDRQLVVGDVVARADGDNGQTGVVVDMHMLVDLQPEEGAITSGVPSERLAALHLFSPGQFVIGGGWVGRVDSIRHDVTIRFDDGTVVTCQGTGMEEYADDIAIMPLDEGDDLFLDEDHYHLYLGQRVSVAQGFSFRKRPELRVLAGGEGGNRHGTIISIAPNSIFVEWHAAASLTEEDGTDIEPPEEVRPEALVPLTSFKSTNWHLGDRAVLLPAGATTATITAELLQSLMAGHFGASTDVDAARNAEGEVDGAGDSVSAEDHSAAAATVLTGPPGTASPTGKQSAPAGRTSLDRPAKRGKRRTGGSGAAADAEKKWEMDVPFGGSMVQVVLTTTTADIRWQDGTLQTAVPARDLIPMDHLDEHDFFVGDLVEEVDPFADMEAPEAMGAGNQRRSGHVLRVNGSARTAVVRWDSPDSKVPGPTQAPSSDSGETRQEEDVSCYALRPHADFQFSLGDIVLRLYSDAAAAPEAVASSPAAPAAPAAAQAALVSASAPRSRAGWKEYISPSGVPYYHNAHLGESSWDKPPALWSRQERADAGTDWRMYNKDGRDYFYNAKTGKSTWKVPSEVAAARAAASAESADAFATLAPDPAALRRVGEVMGLADGKVRLRWASGAEELVSPQELYVLAREDDDEVSSGAEDDMPLRDLAGFPAPEHDDPGVAGSDSDESGGWETDEGSDRANEDNRDVDIMTSPELSSLPPPDAPPSAPAGPPPSAPQGSRMSDMYFGGLGDSPQLEAMSETMLRVCLSEAMMESMLAQIVGDKLDRSPRMYRMHAALSQALAAQRAERPIPLPALAAEMRPAAASTAAWLKASFFKIHATALNAADGAPPPAGPLGGTGSAAPPADAPPGTGGQAGAVLAALVGGEAEAEAATGAASAAHGTTAAAVPSVAAAVEVPQDAASVQAAAASPSQSGASSMPEAAAGGDGPGAPPPAELYGFPQFDTVDDFSDHKFAQGGQPAQNPRAFQRRVRKEWESLQVGLPSTIWVRAYESRTDLLRAAMLGPAGTPYHDGLFLFDIRLPHDYPTSPPEVHYHSWGMRVNPNLYENGYVCLSLLGTWNGKAVECWNPETSTLLQVLVSIQGLVLTAEPYYNEAGYERQVGSRDGARNAPLYNENTFLLSARSMAHVIRRPPAHFAPLVRAHFRERKDAILSACDAYAAGTAALGCELASSSARPAAPGPGGSSEQASAPSGEGASAVPDNGGAPAAQEAAPSAGGPAPAASNAAPEGSGGVPGSGAGPKPTAPSEGFRLLLQQLKPRLAAAIDSLG